MPNRTKLLLAALSATIVLGALVSTATARRLALSNQTYRVTWTGLDLSAFGVHIRCPVTIEGSFHSRTLSKNPEQLIGYVTVASVGPPGNCTGGSAWILTTNLPWHIRYDSFIAERGLPFIQGIKLRLILAEFLIQTPGAFGGVQRCLYRSSVASPMKGVVNRNTATGEVTSLTPEAAQIPVWRSELNGEIVGCPAGTLSSASNPPTIQGETAKITVTLVA